MWNLNLVHLGHYSMQIVLSNATGHKLLKSLDSAPHCGKKKKKLLKMMPPFDLLCSHQL